MGNDRKIVGIIIIQIIVFFVVMAFMNDQKSIDEWQNEGYMKYVESPQNYQVCEAVITGAYNELSMFATGEELWWNIKYTTLEGQVIEDIVLRDKKSKVGDKIEVAYEKDVNRESNRDVVRTCYVENPIIKIYKVVLIVDVLLGIVILMWRFLFKKD